jgi:hypothetical protein
MPENVIRPAVSKAAILSISKLIGYLSCENKLGCHLSDNGLVCCMCQYTNKTLKIVFIPHSCFLTNDVVDKLENIDEAVILSRYLLLSLIDV